MNMIEMFQALMESEIEFSITARPHGGFSLTMGDEADGPHDAGTVANSEDIGVWLDATARRLFPDSDFVKATQA